LPIEGVLLFVVQACGSSLLDPEKQYPCLQSALKDSMDIIGITLRSIFKSASSVMLNASFKHYYINFMQKSNRNWFNFVSYNGFVE
jgi:hypothetical protein